MPITLVRPLVIRSVAIATHKKRRIPVLTGFTGENTRTKGERSDLTDPSPDLTDPSDDRRGSDWLSDVYSRSSQLIEPSTAEFTADSLANQAGLSLSDRDVANRIRPCAALGGQGGRGSDLLTGVGKFPTGNRADSLFNKGGHSWTR
jgi:hypothetical protein